MDDWHLSRNGKQLGIYPEDRLREYIAQGRVSANDLVWKTGMAQWLPAGDVFGIAAPPPLPEPESAVEPSAPAVAARAWPAPPKLHWVWVLLLSVVTLGLFYVVWAFVQAVWVRRIDPNSNAVVLLVVYLVLSLAGELIAGEAARESAEAVVGALVSLAGVIVSIVAFFSMRRSIVTHYNEAEPTGLKLSAAMTFFFNVLYFQHHLTRIARAKEDGGR